MHTHHAEQTISISATIVQRLEQLHAQEQAADLLLRAAVEALEQTLNAQRHYKAQPLRALLHLRSAERYEALYTIEIEPQTTTAESSAGAAQLWRWVEQWRCAFALDVGLGLLQSERGQHKVLDLPEELEDATSSQISLMRYLGQRATHIHVNPLRDPTGALVGMMLLEVACQNAVGTSFVWAALRPKLAIYAALCTPFILAHPATSDAQEPCADPLLPVVGQAMRPVIKLLHAFAAQDETILLSGATGVGKSRLARWCHARSTRAAQPFEVLDLLSIPPDMHMAHLVGWRRGAFTSADKDVEGAIARAQGGTLFIDEVDKLSLDTQAGLLRLIEERTWRPLGDSGKLRSADLRFLIGTNISLIDAVARGTFREDLYYRLHVLPCSIPSLAQRADEIEAWANYMIQQRASLDQRPSAPLGPEACALLRAHPWPGNLRQLDNVLRRAYIIQGRQHVVQIDAETLRVATAMEQVRAPAQLPSEPAAALRHAARTLVSTAIQHQREGHPIDLDALDSIRGLALEEAREHLGSIKDAFALFDRQQLIDSRNHHKAFRRELERAHAFIASLT